MATELQVIESGARRNLRYQLVQTPAFYIMREIKFRYIKHLPKVTQLPGASTRGQIYCIPCQGTTSHCSILNQVNWIWLGSIHEMSWINHRNKGKLTLEDHVGFLRVVIYWTLEKYFIHLNQNNEKKLHFKYFELHFNAILY